MNTSNISLNEEEYRRLLKMNYLATSVLGILGDYFPDAYKDESDKIDSLQKHFLGYATDFGCGDLVENYKGEIILKEKIYEDFTNTMDDYDEFIFQDELETRLGYRDLARELTDAEKTRLKDDIRFMVEKTEEYSQRYRDEFEKYGIERLEVKKT